MEAFHLDGMFDPMHFKTLVDRWVFCVDVTRGSPPSPHTNTVGLSSWMLLTTLVPFKERKGREGNIHRFYPLQESIGGKIRVQIK